MQIGSWCGSMGPIRATGEFLFDQRRTSEELTALHVDPSQQVGWAVRSGGGVSGVDWWRVGMRSSWHRSGADIRVSLSSRQRGEVIYGGGALAAFDVVVCLLVSGFRSLRETLGGRAEGRRRRCRASVGNVFRLVW